MRQARNDAGFDWVANDYNDWDILRCLLCCERGRDVKRHDYVDLKSNELSCELRKSRQLSFRRPKLECNVLAFHIAKLAQTFPKICLKQLLVCGSDVENANSRYF